MAAAVATLRISLEESGVVSLTIEDSSLAFSKFRIAITERTRNARSTSQTKIELPWWEFAPILPQIPVILRLIGDVRVEVDARTRELLARTNQAHQSLLDAATTPPLAEAEVRAILKEVDFRRELTRHQLGNVCRLASISNSCSFSVPGAGKTTEALATYAVRSRLQDRILVVCPKNAFPAWEEQVAACLPQLEVLRLTGGKTSISSLLRNAPPIALVTYSQLIGVSDDIAHFLAQHPTVMILDESHRVKRGESGAWGSTVLSLSHLPRWKMILTGTPMPNGPDDLEPQLRFLYPKIAPGTDPVAAVQGIYVRTTKAELGLRSPKVNATAIPMTDAQARVYELCASEAARDIKKSLQARDRIALRSIGKHYILLLQLASNPALLSKHRRRLLASDVIACLQSDSPKIVYACHRARELAASGNKVIIWSGFRENVEIIAERLRDVGADFIHGGVEAGSDEEDETRERKVKRFLTDDAASVLVANPAACSEGISLHSRCHHAIYVDRNYNAALYLQSADRIHRLGLPPDQDTYIEILYSRGTIDESVNRRLAAKIEAMEAVLNDRSIHVTPQWREVADLPDGDDILDLLGSLENYTTE